MIVHPAFNNDNPLYSCKVTELLSNRDNIQGGGVYQIRNVSNNKVYIGSTKNFYDRFKQHYYSLINNANVSKLQNDWNSHGIDKPFTFDILKVVSDNTDREMLYNLEQVYLNEHRPFECGYNTIKESESTVKYKSSNKRLNNIKMTKELEIARYECLEYLKDNANKLVEAVFQYEEKKMTPFVYDKLIKLYTIFPCFYRAVLDYVVPQFPDMECKLKIIAWTIYLRDDNWPQFRIRGQDNNQDFIRYDISYDQLIELQQTLNLAYYDIFKLIFTNQVSFNKISIVENKRKRKGSKRSAASTKKRMLKIK
ncbi:GIY-YIG nuclease family protein [Paenibacillus sp. XY044]|uniref:GIY-YIG nuclease family protein n=1 Tax=Paenibacillus sp. XY044 TaxID=2026089 RepID=UPI000B9914CD|nr:GIY-YIG nuclease family protein [Paenibacillus sp. XY044]OZB98043.1 hypothetical protein CJP46_02435 [Paenibacillus sp. XY044]